MSIVLLSKATYLRSNVLQFEWTIRLIFAGLCGGRLRGPSMLRDINEFLREFWLSLALKIPLFEFVIAMVAVDVDAAVATPLLMSVREFGWLEPGVLDVERWFFGDDGAEPTVLRDYQIKTKMFLD